MLPLAITDIFVILCVLGAGTSLSSPSELPPKSLPLKSTPARLICSSTLSDATTAVTDVSTTPLLPLPVRLSAALNTAAPLAPTTNAASMTNTETDLKSAVPFTLMSSTSLAPLSDLLPSNSVPPLNPPPVSSTFYPLATSIIRLFILSFRF